MKDANLVRFTDAMTHFRSRVQQIRLLHVYVGVSALLVDLLLGAHAGHGTLVLREPPPLGWQI